MLMLGLLFPRVIDNRFRGQWLGYWLMVPILVLKFGIAAGSILTPRQANKADAIDLSTYSVPALHDAMTSTALLGLLHLCIGLICLLAMIRYRAMVPLVYLWLLVEFLGRRVILELYPIGRVNGPSSGSIVNLVLFAMLALGFALSVWPRRDAPDPSAA
jgi:DMSO reductase anchor subunit